MAFEEQLVSFEPVLTFKSYHYFLEQRAFLSVELRIEDLVPLVWGSIYQVCK